MKPEKNNSYTNKLKYKWWSWYRKHSNKISVLKVILTSAVYTSIVSFMVSLPIGLVVMLLWNWIMPAVFEVGHIGYFQAVGLSMLMFILVKSPVSN